MTYETPFNIAMALMDEVMATGVINESRTKLYKGKAPYILTMIINELAPLDGVTLTNTTVNSITDTSELDNRTMVMVVPYGLASNLLLKENPTLSNFFNQKYDESKGKILTQSKAITDVYGVGEA